MGGKTLTRADLAEAVFQKVGLPRNESAEIVELVLREIVASLERGDTVKLSSFALTTRCPEERRPNSVAGGVLMPRRSTIGQGAGGVPHDQRGR